MAIDTAELTISAENTFTSPVEVSNYFNLSITDPLGSIVTLQRRFNNGAGGWGSWRDIATFTTASEEIGFSVAKEQVQHRLGIKTGDYGSGSVTVRISQ